MSEPRSRNASSNGLERKLAAYVAASGAFLAISASGPVQAGIYYSGPQDITVPFGDSSSYTMNVTDGGPLAGNTTDFTFTNTPSVYYQVLTVTSPVGTSQVVLDGSYAAALDAGTLISSASTFGGGNTTTTMGAVSFKGKKGDFGPWANVSNMYLGLTFNDPGNTYYGWAELSFSDFTGTATVEGWAYETDPGVGIVAGAGAVPEPSTLALSVLAMGSIGVAALHRSRKAVKDAPAA